MQDQRDHADTRKIEPVVGLEALSDNAIAICICSSYLKDLKDSSQSPNLFERGHIRARFFGEKIVRHERKGKAKDDENP